MAVTHQQILHMTESTIEGARVLHLVDGRGVVMTAAWVAENRPEVGGYLIDNGRGEVWFAKNSVDSMAAVLVQVQHVKAGAGDLVLFKLPLQATAEEGETLRRFVQRLAPELPALVVSGLGVEVMTISAQQLVDQRLAAAESQA